jgi:hypothetical protein
VRRNRRVRDQIEAIFGAEVVEEISRWNDGRPDSLVDFGVSVSDREANLQEDSYFLLDAPDLDTV